MFASDQRISYNSYTFNDESPSRDSMTNASLGMYGDQRSSAAGLSHAALSADSILLSVEEQEARFERLTQELEAERRSVADQLEQVGSFTF